ncbi:MAG: hypothetical protein L0H63_12320 [Nitrococcus sp.]|nr:hypothetical protein [Nitrococcus sp.]
MNQLTLRGLDKELEGCIRQLAEHEHISMNKAALKLMRRGSALDRAGPDSNMIGDRLDDFIGSWNAADAADFDNAVAVFGEIDPEQWQ